MTPVGKKDLPSAIPPWMGLLSRLVVGGVLITAGTMKAAAPSQEFALVIQYYRLPFLSINAIPALAAFLPWIELYAGLCLVSGYLTRKSAALAGLLFLSFLAALASVKLRGIPLPSCGCFGRAFHPSIIQGLILDSFLFCLSLVAWRAGACVLSLDRWCSAEARSASKPGA